jgi:hypothetical protein
MTEDGAAEGARSLGDDDSDGDEDSDDDASGAGAERVGFESSSTLAGGATTATGGVDVTGRT